jgi:flagellar secretion chaperone FliS
MSMPEDVAQAYTNTASKTVSNGPLLLVALYDRLANDLEVAKQYIWVDEIESADSSLQHAQKIVIVLRSGLQVDGFDGGDDLRRLYNTLVDLLVKANINKDVETIELCQQIVAPLHEAWTEAVARELEKGMRGAAAGVV